MQMLAAEAGWTNLNLTHLENQGKKNEVKKKKEEEEEEEEKVDSLHMLFLELYPELIAYPCLFHLHPQKICTSSFS